MTDIEPDPADQRAADELLMWARQLRDDTWDQPGHHRRALAALILAETTAGWDGIEHQLIAALISRMRWRAGKPAHSGRADDWREQAFVDATTAVDMMRAEKPPLTGHMDIRAVTE